MKLILALLLLAPSVAMGQVTFKVCGNSTTASFTTKDMNGKQTDKLFVWCPPDATGTIKYRALTLAGCVGPAVKRIGSDYTVTCKTWNAYELVPKK
jgi:hypothetical protein